MKRILGPLFRNHALACLAAWGMLLGQSAWAQAVGDRHPDRQYTFPPDAFYHTGKGGRVIDVTKPPFNANPVPSTLGHEHDDTAALVAAFNFIIDRERTNHYSSDADFIIYLPDGIYDVSDTIAESVEPAVFYDRKGAVYLRVWGQSREGTIIRLRDHALGFGKGAHKPVLALHKWSGSNAETVNSVANLTVLTGQGNPGAIGVQYLAANEGDLANLTVRSGDGQGEVGLNLPLFSVQALMTDITIEGFDYGIRAVHQHEVNPVLEHVTLRHQRVAGIDVVNGTVLMRALDSDNTVPAATVTGSGGHLQLISSHLFGGSTDSTAIDLRTNGCLFVRDVQVNGYRTAIQHLGLAAATGDHVEEWVSHEPATLFPGQPAKSLNLQVRDAPQVPWFDPATEWESPDLHGAVGDGQQDDSKAIQAAFDSGKPCIYFPRKVYKTSGSIRIPASVRRVELLFAWVGGHFVVDESSSRPLLVENSGSLFGKGASFDLRLRQPRTIVCHLLSGSFHNELPEGTAVDVYLEDLCGGGGSYDFCPPGERLWARELDCEGRGTPMWRVHGGLMWTTGFKSEQSGGPFLVENGGWLEVVGGYVNRTLALNPNFVIVNSNANASAVLAQTFARPWTNFIREVRGDVTHEMYEDQFPFRGVAPGRFLPLYAGYNPETLPAPDRNSPPIPVGLKASSATGLVQLEWAETQAPDLGGYLIYRACNAGGPYQALHLVAGPPYTDRTPGSSTRFYVITALDTAGNESVYSQEVKSAGP